MELRIFRSPVIVLIALMVISSTSFAQKNSVAIPADSDILAPVPGFDNKAFEKSMADMQVKMRVMQKQMTAKMRVAQKQMDAKMHSKEFKDALKKLANMHMANFDEDIDAKDLDSLTAQLSDIAPQIAEGFKDFGKNFDQSDKQATDDLVEKIKSYSKSYAVDANDKLEIDNRYGKVTVNTWDKNEFKVDVQIKVATNGDSNAQKLLDNVVITDSKQGSVVSFKTSIGKENSSWGSWFSGDDNETRKMEINYTIYMPSKNALEITNKYGATVLPDFDGKLSINSAYGSFTAKALSNASNDINVKYGNAIIGSVAGSDLNVSYGRLDLGSADNLNADVNYSSAKIGKINITGSINIKYSGGFAIGDLDKKLKSLAVNASYSTIKVGLSGDENADFDITVHYGSFDHGDHDVTVTSQSPNDDRGYNPTKSYKGKIGKGNSDKNITINSNYGSVKFD